MPTGYRMNIKSTDWKEIVIRALIKKGGGICELCNKILGDNLVEVDHIKEKHNGGIDELENLRLVHMQCHRLRHGTYKRLPVIDTEPRNIKEIRRQADMDTVRALKYELLKHHRWGQAATKIGLTVDQARYLRIKYGLGKNPNTWNL